MRGTSPTRWRRSCRYSRRCGKPPRRQRGSRRLLWAEALRRGFGLDLLTCPRCGHQRKLIALIEMPSVARRILEHLGLAPDAPPLSPARPPPEELYIGAVMVLSGAAAARGGVCLESGFGALRGHSG